MARRAVEDWCVLQSTAQNKPLQTMLAGNLALVISKEKSEMGILKEQEFEEGNADLPQHVPEGVQMARLGPW